MRNANGVVAATSFALAACGCAIDPTSPADETHSVVLKTGYDVPQPTVASQPFVFDTLPGGIRLICGTGLATVVRFAQPDTGGS
jgi:hypothetical protein